VLTAWKLRRRAAFQIHQKICSWPTPSFFDHVPRLPHIDSIKFMEPTLSDEQLQIILNKLLRLNPARPDLANRTFGRRRRRIQQQLQPPPEPTPVLDTHTTELNFTINIEHRPQARPTLSLIASLPYCVCCLCGYDHSTPDCPPRSALPPSPHTCQLQTTEDDPMDPPRPCPRPSSPTRTGRHCTGTSGKPKTSTAYPPPPRLPPAMDPTIQRPLTTLPDPPSPAACAHKPPYKCTSHPSTPTDTLPTHPTTTTAYPSPTTFNIQYHHQAHQPTAHQTHRHNNTLHAANQRPTSYSTFLTAAQLHSPALLSPTRQQSTEIHTTTNSQPPSPGPTRTGHQPTTTQLDHAIT
jgi:hypothetical protein